MGWNNSFDQTPVQGRESLLAAICIAFALGLLMLPGIFQVPSRDGGLFLYIAQGMLQGEVPYRDTFDQKMPGIFFTYATGLFIFMGKHWGPWILDLIAIGIASWLQWRLLRALQGPLVALIVSLIWILAIPDLRDRGALTEDFTLPLQVAVPWILLWWRRQSDRMLWPVLLGMLAGAAFLYRQNHVVLFIMAFPLGTLLLGAWQGLRYVARSFLWCCLGTATVLVPVLVYFLFHDALGELWNATFAYNFQYTQVTLPERLDALGFGIERIPWIHGAFLVWLVLVGRLALRRSWPQGARGKILMLAVLALPMEMVVSTASGRHFQHYFLMWMPAGALLLAEFFAFILRAGSSSARRMALSRTVAAILMLLVLLNLRYEQVTDMYQRVRDDGADAGILASVSYLRTHTRPEDPVHVWGAAPVVLALANRRSPSRFSWHYPLLIRGELQEAFTEEFVEEIRTTPPLVLIDDGHAYFPRLDREQRTQPELPDIVEARVYRDLSPAMEPFFEQVDRDYVKVESFEGYDVFVLRSSLPKDPADR